MTAPIIKYKTGGWNKAIERVECVRETPSFIVRMIEPTFGKGKPQERKEAKRTNWDAYHDTWEDARTFLVSERACEIARAKEEIQRAEERIDKALKEIAVLRDAVESQPKV